MSEKIVKKKWYPIVAPKFLGEVLIGETYLDEPSKSIGRKIKVNLMQLTGDVKNQNIEVNFTNNFETRICGYYFSPGAIKRYVRRHITRIDDSIVAKSLDEKKIRIKPFLITKSKVTRKIEYLLRKEIRTEIIQFINKNNYENIFNSVIKGQIQKELKDKLNKIYPIKVLEIRTLKEEKKDAIETKIPVKNTTKKLKEEN